MKAEHLRLNNLVKVNWEDEHRWCALDFWEVTEEWLERFGFEEDDSVGWLKRFDKSDSFFIDLSFMYWGENSVKLTHVHQLQNLYFALTGEELTIKKEEE